MCVVSCLNAEWCHCWQCAVLGPLAVAELVHSALFIYLLVFEPADLQHSNAMRLNVIRINRKQWVCSVQHALLLDPSTPTHRTLVVGDTFLSSYHSTLSTSHCVLMKCRSAAQTSHQRDLYQTRVRDPQGETDSCLYLSYALIS